jgi:hypothetical protein
METVEYLVDPRYQHHNAAETLAEALLGFLRSGLRESLKADRDTTS